jgi:4-hydroxy-tetrahydrodipicolinate reductase
LLKKASRRVPLLYSANMSLGVAVVGAMIKQFGAVKDWKFRIEEIHHTRKKDKPSGTAKMLAARLVDNKSHSARKYTGHTYNRGFGAG